jgi:hypothetical protein
VPHRFLDLYEEQELWTPYAFPNVLRYPGAPARAISTFTAFCSLAVIMVSHPCSSLCTIRLGRFLCRQRSIQPILRTTLPTSIPSICKSFETWIRLIAGTRHYPNIRRKRVARLTYRQPTPARCKSRPMARISIPRRHI